jgi:hypothetical protein
LASCSSAPRNFAPVTRAARRLTAAVSKHIA